MGAYQLGKIDRDKVWSIAHTALGRLACEYANPTDGLHDHAACIVDDESRAADLLLRVAVAAVTGDDDTILTATLNLQNALKDPA